MARYDNELIEDLEDVIVMGFVFPKLDRDFSVDGEVVIKEGYRAVYFEFANKWHDIIKVYDQDGAFKGYYCDMNTPIERFEGGFFSQDLCLDLWVFPDLGYHALDMEEFERAKKEDWITPYQAGMARRTLDGLIMDIEDGRFPPDIVGRYD